MKHKYAVDVVRTVHQTKTILIKATSRSVAKGKAISQAANEDFSGLEKEATYEVEDIRQFPPDNDEQK